MSPEYLYELADIADPDQLWRRSGLDQQDLPPVRRKQLDMGVALRRHASDRQDHLNALADGRSLLVTPLSSNGSARKTVDTPPDHAKLRRFPR